jgi:hypothetical protein
MYTNKLEENKLEANIYSLPKMNWKRILWNMYTDHCSTNSLDCTINWKHKITTALYSLPIY